MRAFWAHLVINLKLTARDRMVLFFNYAFPLVFFFFFGQIMHAEQGGVAVYVVSMVLTMGVLGNGFFGAGVRSAQDREQNILRRFKVTPITPSPILLGSLATGLINYLPAVALILSLAHVLWGMSFPRHLGEFFIFVSISILAFRSIGLIIAASVNSMQEAQVLVQLLYLPMLLLSIMPVTELPAWGQVAAQFIPAGYLQIGMQGILIRQEGLAENASAIGALLITMLAGTFIAGKLFRWDKDEKVRPAAKLWIAAVLAPFFLLGAYQIHTRDALAKARVLQRNLLRGQNLLIRNARIFSGNGRVIESGAVFIKAGKIERIFENAIPEARQLKAEAIEGAGKTVLPGLIDFQVHLSASGGFSNSPSESSPEKLLFREAAAYLYSGVTAVRSSGDPLSTVLRVRATINSGERLGAEFYSCGPVFTAPDGYGTEYFRNLPAALRKRAEEQTLRTPTSADEARQQVREFKARGVDCIKAILDRGTPSAPFNRMEAKIFAAVAEEAHAQALPLTVHTGDARDVADAVGAGAANIERGSLRDSIPQLLFERMRAQKIAYDPALAAIEAWDNFSDGTLDPLERPLVQQVAPRALLQQTKDFIDSEAGKGIRAKSKLYRAGLEQGRRNLLNAWQTGVRLVAGSGSGSPLLMHGPAVHREMQLWVDAGIPPAAALQAATSNSAISLGRREIGLIEPGCEASLLIVDGNPLKDIRQTESISQVIIKGERVRRSGLFEQE